MDKNSSNSHRDESCHSQPNPKHSGLLHMLMMAVCCLVPLAGALVLSQLGYGNAASFLMLLLCPLMHLFMMRGHGSKKEEGGNAEQRRDGGG